MAKQRTWTIHSGPSKYDFLEALSFRKYPTQKVRMTIQEEKGLVSVERNIIIHTISKKSDGFPTLEQHNWGFVGYIDSDGYKGSRAVEVVGEYSTKGRRGKMYELSEDSSRIIGKLLFRYLPGNLIGS